MGVDLTKITTDVYVYGSPPVEILWREHRGSIYTPLICSIICIHAVGNKLF